MDEAKLLELTGVFLIWKMFRKYEPMIMKNGNEKIADKYRKDLRFLI